MAKFKTRSDDEIAWSNKPGNRGKIYPGDEMARKQYDRDKAAGENNLSAVRNFLFGKSDARKQGVEDAVNARRDAGKSIPLEPYVAPVREKAVDLSTDESRPSFVPPVRNKKGDIQLIRTKDVATEGGEPYEYPRVEFEGYRAKKGGKISLKDCKVSTHTKNKKQSNW